jgi:F-type H+-transporting ATPase subunit b
MTRPNQLHSLSLFIPALFNEVHPHTVLLFASGGVHPAISKAVNLTIFVVVLYLLLRKPVREFFEQRRARVREMLDKAAREREEAMAKMAELEARLSLMGAEVTEIKAQAQREAEAERERMEAEAKRDIEKVRLSARREIEAAKQIALADLQEFAATKAVDLAEQLIRHELTPADDARLVERVSEELIRAK